MVYLAIAVRRRDCNAPVDASGPLCVRGGLRVADDPINVPADAAAARHTRTSDVISRPTPCRSFARSTERKKRLNQMKKCGDTCALTTPRPRPPATPFPHTPVPHSNTREVPQSAAGGALDPHPAGLRTPVAVGRVHCLRRPASTWTNLAPRPRPIDCPAGEESSSLYEKAARL